MQGRHAAGRTVTLVHAVQVQVGGGQGGHGDPGLGQHRGVIAQGTVGHHRQLGHMAQVHAALPAVAHRPIADRLDLGSVGVQVEVQVKIQIDVVPHGHREQDVDLRQRVAVGIGAAAQKVGPLRQRLFQKRLGAGIVGQAFLGKGADLQVQRKCIVVLQGQHCLQAAQSGARVDLDMGAHVHGALPDRGLDHLCAAAANIVDGKVAL